jgi:hypothetical protein
MTVPSVQTTNQNLQQGTPDGIENRFLIVGTGTENKGTLQFISGTSDIEALLGVGALSMNVQALIDNAKVGGDVYGAVYVLNANEDFNDALAAAKFAGFDAELLVIADMQDTEDAIKDVQTELISLKLKGQFMAGVIAVPGINEDESWSEYATKNTQLLGSISADHICIVPQLTETCLGALVGRLCRSDLSVGDTPVRTKTGPMLSLGSLPDDKNGVGFDMAQATALNAIRLSVPVDHNGQPGIYWSDASLLDGPTGDFKNLEILRVILKGSRLVHSRMFSRLGDRTLNRSAASTKAGEDYAKAPLNDMARTRTNNEPGEIYKPVDGDVQIFWINDEEFEVSLAMQPIKSAKKIKNKIHVKQSEVQS